MPKFEVLLAVEESIHYYVEADDPDHAEVIARQMFVAGEVDENPSAGWSKITSANIKEIPPCPAS